MVCPNQIKLIDQVSLQHKTKMNMDDLTSSIPTYPKITHLKLPWVFKLKTPRDLLSRNPLDLPYQDIMR